MIGKYRFCRIDRKGCIACGSRKFEQLCVINDALASSWGLTQKERSAFDRREGHFCAHCRMSRRVRMLLWTLTELYSGSNPLRILHLNQVNDLSLALRRFGGVVETIYRPDLERGTPVHDCFNENICDLTFRDAEFDLAVHSETLEHVFDFRKALDEVKRVLKPGGCQVYTLPLLHDRVTRQRMRQDERGQVVSMLPPSYHGNSEEFPVVWEFGYDFVRERGKQLAKVYYDNYWKNPTVFAVVERKPAWQESRIPLVSRLSPVGE
jgi:SAM-dependent methyltransferase